ncbi:MAG: hypothetical protein ACRCW2_09420 [Cellulosilyticaceae bacterium]
MKLDHVDCELIEEEGGLILKMMNCTRYDAEVKVHIDDLDELPTPYASALQVIPIKSGEILELAI